MPELECVCNMGVRAFFHGLRNEDNYALGHGELWAWAWDLGWREAEFVERAKAGLV